MKKSCTFAVVLFLLGLGFVLEGCKEKTAAENSSRVTSNGSPGSSGITSAEQTSFKEVTSKLDAGGNFYLYLGTEQWLKNLSGKIESVHSSVASMPNLQDQRADIDNAFNVGTHVIKDSGLEDISGIGMSSIAREPGVYYNKMIVHHYAGKGNGFLWTMFGKEPHELDGLDLLPSNTAMAAFYDLDSAQIWSVIQKECEQSGFPQATEFLKEFPQQFEKSAGMKWDDAVGSLDGEFGIVVTLDEAKTVRIPLPTQEALEIPEPGLMLVVKTKNEAIFNRIDELLKKSKQQGLISVNQNGLKMRTMPVPIPFPMTLRPSVATSGGYFFFATSDTLIQEALAVKGGKAGLKSTDEFKKLSANVPQQGNQFCFLSRHFGEIVVKIQQQVFAMNRETPPELKKLMNSFLNPDKAAFAYAVGANTDEGWMAVGNGTQGGGNSVLAASAVIPGMLAAIAVPNFVKARETAQKNTCINNLRMIDGAKQQWALEKDKKASDVPSWGDIQPYLTPGKATLHCPKGGEYALGAVGERPSCSVFGHELP